MSARRLAMDSKAEATRITVEAVAEANVIKRLVAESKSNPSP